MRFTALFAIVAISATKVASSPVESRDLLGDLLGGADLSEANSYGAPTPPWNNGTPGWYFGTNADLIIDLNLPCLEGLLCTLLALLPTWLQCPQSVPPPPPNGLYAQTFQNLTGATEASDYLTYGLVDTVAECEAMCNSVSGCAFINTYYDVNGKGGSTQLTCSLFSLCHDSSDAINYGGQTQPDGSVDYIVDSNGYCKI